MNYEAARQIDPKSDRPDAGKWRYTNFCDSISKYPYPIGYCAKDCPGHDTAAEADEHWYVYQVDHLVERHMTVQGVKDGRSKCQVPECDGWTNRNITTDGYGGYFVCEAHTDIKQAYMLADPFVPGIVSVHS